MSANMNIKPRLDLDDCGAQAEVARYRLWVIKPLLRLDEDQPVCEAVKARVHQIRASQSKQSKGKSKGRLSHPHPPRSLCNRVSERSVHRWLQAYVSSGHDLRALVPKTRERGKPLQSRLDSEVERILTEVLNQHYLRAERASIDDIHHITAARIEAANQSRAADDPLALPSRATVARRIRTFNQHNRQAVLIAKRGRRSARKVLAQVNATPYPDLPLERVEMDHTRVDLLVVDEQDGLPLGRPTLTYCLDMATRLPLGYYLGFEPASYYTVMEALHHAICPKPDVQAQFGTEHPWAAYGIPATLIIDNAKEFIGKDLSDACDVLGIGIQRAPVKTPEFKGGLERHFGTLNTGLMHTLPGTTFSDPKCRGEYDSTQQACITVQNLKCALNIFIVDVYAQRFHVGLKGVPAQRWDQALQMGFLPRLPSNRDELKVLLGRTCHRVVNRYGIEFEGLRYNTSELAPLRFRLGGERAKVKYHPADLSRVYVHDPFERRYLEVPALAEDYTHGLSVWKHRVIRRFALAQQDEIDLAALGRAKLKIQGIVDEARSHTRKCRLNQTRVRAARWRFGTASDRSNQPDPTCADAVNMAPPESTVESTYASDTDNGDDWEMVYALPKSRIEFIELNELNEFRRLSAVKRPNRSSTS